MHRGFTASQNPNLASGELLKQNMRFGNFANPHLSSTAADRLPTGSASAEERSLKSLRDAAFQNAYNLRESDVADRFRVVQEVFGCADEDSTWKMPPLSAAADRSTRVLAAKRDDTVSHLLAKFRTSIKQNLGSET